MKVVCHIKNDDNYMDKQVCMEIEMPCRPMRGDCLYNVSNQIEKKLDLNDKETYQMLRKNYGSYFYGSGFSLCDCIYVDSIAFVNRNNNVECHIELCDTPIFD